MKRKGQKSMPSPTRPVKPPPPTAAAPAGAPPATPLARPPISPAATAAASLAALMVRGAAGGVLMGLANLVPGISGGTMLLAVGVYPLFVGAVADLSTLRLRLSSLVLLGSVGVAAALAILLLAGGVKDLVVHHRWVMYSLFIGLTLGGLPVVWRLARPAAPSLWIGAAAGLVAMSLLVLAQSGAGESGAPESGAPILILAGVLGASAMILPGVSGGYLLLVLGQYVPILSAVDAVKSALARGVMAEAAGPALQVLLPVGIGAAVGIVALSNALRWLLRRHARPTLGVLLGLLLGAVVGLWPFQRPVEPVPGQTVVKGRLLSEADLDRIDAQDLPTEFFPPSAGQVGGSLLLIGAGFAATLGIARLGRERPEAGRPGRS